MPLPGTSLAPSTRRRRTRAATCFALSRRIHANPELRFEEHKAAAWLGEFVGRAGARGRARRRRACRRRFARARASLAEARASAILAEYDALPGVGHACGHNLIAAGGGRRVPRAPRSVAEAVGRRGRPPRDAGRGGRRREDPADRGGRLRRDRRRDDVPPVRSRHPRPPRARLALARRSSSSGEPAHAAVAPHDGQQRAHGVPRHLPAHRRAARSLPRRRPRPRLRHERRAGREHHPRARRLRVQRPRPERRRARAGARHRRALRAGPRRWRATSRSTIAVRQGYTRHGEQPGARASLRRPPRGARPQRPARRDARVGAGSTDMGDVSHVVPSIHPWLAIVDEGAALCHEHRFAEAAATDAAGQTAVVAAKALARTAVEFLADAELRSTVSAEWQRSRTRDVDALLLRRACRSRSPSSRCRWPRRAGARSCRPRARTPTRVPSTRPACTCGHAQRFARGMPRARRYRASIQSSLTRRRACGCGDRRERADDHDDRETLDRQGPDRGRPRPPTRRAIELVEARSTRRARAPRARAAPAR